MQAKPNRLIWTRIASPVGDYCDGYQAKGIDGLRIMRHHVDDRAYDGGYVHTYWNLWAHGKAIDQYPSLSSAKEAAEKLWRWSTGRMTDAQEAAIELIDNISTSTVQRDGTVEIETEDGWRYFAADGHEVKSERENLAVIAKENADWREGIADAARAVLYEAGGTSAEGVIYGPVEHVGAVIVASDSNGSRVVSRIYHASDYIGANHMPDSHKLRAVVWGRVARIRNEDTYGTNYYVVNRYGDGTIAVYNGMHSILLQREPKLRTVRNREGRYVGRVEE